MDKRAPKAKFRARIHKYTIRLVKFLRSLPKDDVNREIIRQLVKSGSSVGANYFEAQSASSRKDYQKFFNYSLKSANESVFWLSVLAESGIVPSNLISKCTSLASETQELANIFASSILTLKGQR